MDADVYNYDKCAFYRLLDSAKLRAKYEMVQEKQGVVVCPLNATITNNQSAADLINRHLFLPSPLYKNHYVSLAHQIQPAHHHYHQSSEQTDINATTSQLVYLVFNNESTGGGELVLTNESRLTSKSFKLLGTQTAYSSRTLKPFKILIVHSPLTFAELTTTTTSVVRKSSASSLPSSASKASFVTVNDDDDDDDDDDAESHVANKLAQLAATAAAMNDELEVQARQQQQQKQQQQQQQQQTQSHPPPVIITSQFTALRRQALFRSVHDVQTFSQSVEFVSIVTGFIDPADDDDEDDYDDKKKKKKKPKQKRNSKQQQTQMALVERPLGEALLDELDVMRKTYIVIHTHMADCVRTLAAMHRKYLRLFLKAYHTSPNTTDADVELMLSVACENVIVGCMYPKLWPNVLRLHERQDELLRNKMRRVAELIGTAPSAAALFAVEESYFRVNVTRVLRELNKLAMLNNPFEQCACIKASLDLLQTEFTLIDMQNAQTAAAAAPADATVLSSDVLLPLTAYLLVRSEITCLHAVVYFIEHFHFTLKEDDDDHHGRMQFSACRALLAESSFLVATFRAAVQLVEALPLAAAAANRNSV